MMNISDALDPKRIVTGLEAAGSREALTSICETLLLHDAALCGKAVAALLAREDVGSTGIGNGIAIPHAKLAGIDAPLIGIAALRHPIQFGASDGMAIDLLFVVLMPDASEQEPLTLLSRIVKVLRQPGVAEAIRQEIDPASIAGRLMDAEQRFRQAKQGKA